MAQNSAMTPAIRFKGFSDPWEQRKLGDLGFAQSGIGFPDAEQGGAKGTPFFKVSDMNTQGNEHELVLSNNYVTDEQIARMKWHPISQVPAIFFAKVGAAVMLNRKRLVNEPFLLDNNTMAFSMDKESLDPAFGQSLFERLDLTSLVQVGALPSYNSADVEAMDVSVPVSIAEQRLVGQAFSNLDNLITLHQRKCDKLKIFKKSMLDKMFPKPGCDIPEIRFKGFSDPWEQRKAGEIFQISDQRGFPNLPVLSATQDQGMIKRDKTGRFVGHDKNNELSYKRVLPGDFVIHLRSFQGGFAHSAFEGITSPAYTVFAAQTPKCHSDRFWKHFFMSERFIDSLTNVTYGIRDGRSISVEEFMDSMLSFPCGDEQKLIGAQIDSLDNLITLHQRKLDLIKKLKKSMLDKMFV